MYSKGLRCLPAAVLLLAVSFAPVAQAAPILPVDGLAGVWAWISQLWQGDVEANPEGRLLGDATAPSLCTIDPHGTPCLGGGGILQTPEGGNHAGLEDASGSEAVRAKR